MGRAGRPQFDDQGKAVILVHDVKKQFYKKFLYEPFPVESKYIQHSIEQVLSCYKCLNNFICDILAYINKYSKALASM